MRVVTKFRPRAKPPQEPRDELMNSTQRLFFENGVGSTSIEQITGGANVAKGTFYVDFASKDDILLVLRARFVRELSEGLKIAIKRQPEEDWKGKVAAWAKAGITYFLDAAAPHDFVFNEYRPPSLTRAQFYSRTWKLPLSGRRRIYSLVTLQVVAPRILAALLGKVAYPESGRWSR
jgi:AcrR family transcriptional regulator